MLKVVKRKVVKTSGSSDDNKKEFFETAVLTDISRIN